MTSPPKPSFGRARPETERQEPMFDLNSLRDGGEAPPAQAPRWLLPVLIAVIAALVLGGIYFIHTLLAFQAAILAQTTAIYGPYPPFALIFVVIPAWIALLYFVYDFIRFRSGFNPFASPRGIAVSAAVCLAMLALAPLPVTLLRHADNGFARNHGYVRCDSQFDPHHVRVYALKDYVDTYGCPTVSLPQ